VNRTALHDLDGVLLLDKPRGIGSTDALARARRLLGARKGGHGGTLDPMATGLLPLAFGLATRFAHESLDAAKTYTATMLLGITTDSGDAEGRRLQERPVAVDEACFRAAAAAFVGPIAQVPPMHSALKHEGRPLYEYARQGQVIERAARQVHVAAVDLLALSPVAASVAGAPGSMSADIRVQCSKGTYIRTLAGDLGERLGCGAHLIALRREAVGQLAVADAVTLEALEAMDPVRRLQQLRGSDALMMALRPVALEPTLARRFLQGQRLRLAAAAGAEQTERVRVYQDGRLIGTASLVDGLLVPSRLVPVAA